MSRQNIGQKAERVLKLLLGLRNPRAASALIPYGFSEKDLQDGWQRLAALARIRLGAKAPVKDPRVIQVIDEFENTWFPVTRAVLETRYPEVAAAFFRNLSQTSGADVAVTVGTFLDRLSQMEKGEGDFAKDGSAARKSLQDRGLTPELAKEAQAMVDVLASFESGVDAVPEQEQAAEDSLWAWYLEWAGIARVAISDKRLLRTLGFRQNKKGSGDVIDVPGTGNDVPPTPPPPVVVHPPAPPPVVVPSPLPPPVVVPSPTNGSGSNGLPPGTTTPALPPPSGAAHA